MADNLMAKLNTKYENNYIHQCSYVHIEMSYKLSPKPDIFVDFKYSSKSLIFKICFKTFNDLGKHPDGEILHQI